MDFVTSPTPLSPLPKSASGREKEEQAGLVPSHGIFVQAGSHPMTHRPSAVKHVYAFIDTLEECQESDLPLTDRHQPTIALCDIISAVIPLPVK